MCNFHRYNLGRFGSYDRPEWRKQDGYRVVDRKGYVRILMRSDPMANTSGYVFEHRMVMASHLGRVLLSSESIHHVNGNTEDNRLCNLELWSGVGVQPSGQRPKDLVAWARVIVEQYGEDVDSGKL